MTRYNDQIEAIRERMGKDLAILGHHYQSDEVIRHTDIQGDSLELAQRIDSLEAGHIVFCGVFFMAESAAILRRPDQSVHIPDLQASCPMADMADADKVEAALTILNDGRTVIPLTYVNSSAAVKGVVGAFGGSVCTSANAQTMLKWAMVRGDGVLFLPDRHLVVNTANALGLAEEDRLILPQGVIDGDPNLFVDSGQAEDKRLIIWPGYCPIHEEFTTRAVSSVRKNDPAARIVVHPECPPSVVQSADANGSTSFIIKYVAEAPVGSTIYVGTETNLVNRLATEYTGKKTVKPLRVSLCEDMAKITEKNLAALLERIDDTRPVDVPDVIKVPARQALKRMLEACK